jgi:probable F420-dependent oxidoreductase
MFTVINLTSQTRVAQAAAAPRAEVRMQIDTVFMGALESAADQAGSAEAAGFDAVWSAEVGNDPFFPLVLAAGRTRRVALGTGIAVAFGRSPLTVAHAAWDLQRLTGGRFLLGLGSQVKPHVERRYSMPWSHPAARMREYVEALHAIWACWQDGTRLDFRGEFYTHTVMTPFFTPPPLRTPPPKVFVAAVGPGMTRVAGEVADGLLAHSFTTERYLREVTVPAVEPGLASRGADRSAFQLSLPALVATGQSPEEQRAAEQAVRKQIAFYGSTPAYRPILELHGWGELQPRLHALSVRGEWDAMTGLVTDEVLDAFAVVGAPDEVAGRLLARFGGLVDRLQLTFLHETSEGLETRLLGDLRAHLAP